MTPTATSAIEEAEEYLSRRQILKAITTFDYAEAEGADPDRCAAGRWMCHMLLGNYDEAWHESDSIRAREQPDPNRFWTGESVTGKRVLVRCLHGYGDTVQYLRWLPLLNQQASEVTIQAAPEMQQILAHFDDARNVLTWTAPGETDRHLWDMQVEVAELPYLFRATPATLPAPAHIGFDEIQSHLLRERLGPQTKPRIGLVWTGSSFDSSRSIPFEQLHTLLSNTSVEFWSLQAPGNNADWLTYTQRHGWSHRTVAGTDIADMALLASAMDLVITIDTLAAHLAGSLGLPTWTLLKRHADWRWMLDRDDTPWYPTMRLFRQQDEGDWQTVLNRVCRQLRDWHEEQIA